MRVTVGRTTSSLVIQTLRHNENCCEPVWSEPRNEIKFVPVIQSCIGIATVAIYIYSKYVAKCSLVIHSLLKFSLVVSYHHWTLQNLRKPTSAE